MIPTRSARGNRPLGVEPLEDRCTPVYLGGGWAAGPISVAHGQPAGLASNGPSYTEEPGGAGTAPAGQPGQAVTLAAWEKPYTF